MLYMAIRSFCLIFISLLFSKRLLKMKNKTHWFISMIFLSFVLFSCASIPKNAKPVDHFDANRYLGKWYEIARFDFKFEKNLNNTTAQYSMNENGTIQVLNSGYDYVKKR